MPSLVRWWDGICSRCGLCCHEKHYTAYWGGVPPDGIPAVSRRFFIDTSDPCIHLRKGRHCSIYSHRFKTYPHCKRLTLFHALFCGYLPAGCAYVKRFRFWDRGR